MADADVLADRLAEVAIELMCRVRDYPADANARWLAATVAPQEMPALAIVLAAAIPLDRTWLELTQWTVVDRAVDNAVDNSKTVVGKRFHGGFTETRPSTKAAVVSG